MALSDDANEKWRTAAEALQAAQRMPGGKDRIAALRRAGQLRFDADKLRQEMERVQQIQRDRSLEDLSSKSVNEKKRRRPLLRRKSAKRPVTKT
jgi:hypothetical protein